jgi:hypothetical protein
MGVWGKPRTGPWFFGTGGFRVFLNAFPDWSPLLPAYSWNGGCVPDLGDSPSRGGVRSGTRRRRTASASAQAAGGPSQNVHAAGSICGPPKANGCAGATRNLAHATSVPSICMVTL